MQYLETLTLKFFTVYFLFKRNWASYTFYLINLATLVIRYVKSKKCFKKITTIANSICGALCQELCVNNFISLTVSVPVSTARGTDGLIWIFWKDFILTTSIQMKSDKVTSKHLAFEVLEWCCSFTETWHQEYWGYGSGTITAPESFNAFSYPFHNQAILA